MLMEVRRVDRMDLEERGAGGMASRAPASEWV